MNGHKFKVGDSVRVPDPSPQKAMEGKLFLGRIVSITGNGKYIKVKVPKRKPAYFTAAHVKPVYEV